METTAISGPFKEIKKYKYQYEPLSFKTACDTMEKGKECVCMSTGDRIGLCEDGTFKVNFDYIGFETFIETYADEIFREG